MNPDTHEVAAVICATCKRTMTQIQPEEGYPCSVFINQHGIGYAALVSFRCVGCETFVSLLCPVEGDKVEEVRL